MNTNHDVGPVVAPILRFGFCVFFCGNSQSQKSSSLGARPTRSLCSASRRTHGHRLTTDYRITRITCPSYIRVIRTIRGKKSATLPVEDGERDPSRSLCSASRRTHGHGKLAARERIEHKERRTRPLVSAFCFPDFSFQFLISAFLGP